MQQPKGGIGEVLFRGRSRINGAPIVAIATDSSTNRKTGSMIQTWILRADVDPITAVQTGADASICGGCIHRGTTNNGRGRTCYVKHWQRPMQVWKTWRAGRYLGQAVTTAGRKIRLGSYGDPAAVPSRVWSRLLRDCAGWTGYTHQWTHAKHAAYQRWLMASVDSPVERTAARESGWRAFRVRSSADPLLAHETICPASAEGRHKTTCERCGLCDGTGAGDHSTAVRDVAIIAHGGPSILSTFKKRYQLTDITISAPAQKG